MQGFYISIQTNVEGFEMFKPLWKVRGFEGVMVKTIMEGIQKAIELGKSKTKSLSFIVIVADDVDYIPQLENLRFETDAPIFIAASKSDDTERLEALKRGADYYGNYCVTPEANIETALAIINGINRRMIKQNSPPENMAYNNLRLSVALRKGFINGSDMSLTRIEFDTLSYFLNNLGIALSFEQIYNNVWDSERAVSIEEAVRGVIKRLRKKIANHDSKSIIIENVRGIGFRLAEAMSDNL